MKILIYKLKLEISDCDLEELKMIEYMANRDELLLDMQLTEIGEHAVVYGTPAQLMEFLVELTERVVYPILLY